MSIFSRYCLGLASLWLAGCNEPATQGVAFMNELPAKMNVSVAGNITEVMPARHVVVQVPTTKGQSITLYSSGNKIEEYQMGVTPQLMGNLEDRVLVLVQPVRLTSRIWKADYTGLYANHEADWKGPISGWEDLSNRKIYRFPYKDCELSFPEERVPPTLMKGHMLFRMLRTPVATRPGDLDGIARNQAKTNAGKQ